MFNIEKVDMRVKYTREWTFEALSKLMEHKTFPEIKVSEIIVKAGISRATFYRNFSTKEDIVKLKVKMLFEDFFKDMATFYKEVDSFDEQFLIVKFFNKINEEEKVIDTVIRCNLEYLMVEGILLIINYYKDEFYQLVNSNKISEEYIMDIVASSTWTLLSRWYKTGKKETPSRLSKIYLSAFRSVYIALFEDRSQL